MKTHPANLEIDHRLVDDGDESHVRRLPQAGLEPRDAIDAAIALYEMGRYARALSLLEPIAKGEDDARVDALWLMARCHRAAGRHAHAARCLEWALLDADAELSRVVLLFELGVTHEDAGARTEALDCYRGVARHMPTFRDVRARIRSLR